MHHKPPSESFVPEVLARRLATARSIVALTGAGISAESGVPTFREAQTGLWAKFDPLQLATPEAFASDPKRVWEWYAWRRTLVGAAAPNAGHRALAALEQRAIALLLVTQNVDGLHQRAGSTRLVELHGNLFRTVCEHHRHRVERWTDEHIPPRCPECGGRLRPDVVWFGEMLPAAALERAQAATARADVFLSIGTSGEVYPAAALPEVARAAGALVVEINPNSTPLSQLADHCLRRPASEVLPALVDAAFPAPRS